MHSLHYAENHTEKVMNGFTKTELISFNIQKKKSVVIFLTSYHYGFLHKQMGRVDFHVHVCRNINPDCCSCRAFHLKKRKKKNNGRVLFFCPTYETKAS